MAPYRFPFGKFSLHSTSFHCFHYPSYHTTGGTLPEMRRKPFGHIWHPTGFFLESFLYTLPVSMVFITIPTTPPAAPYRKGRGGSRLGVAVVSGLDPTLPEMRRKPFQQICDITSRSGAETRKLRRKRSRIWARNVSCWS